MRSDRPRHLRALLVASVAVLAAFGTTVPAQDESWLAEIRARAEGGDADAQYQLAMRLLTGIDVPRDDTEAASWALRAAEQDHVDAQFFLGTMYNAGTGVPQDDYEAVAWFRMAAEAGHPDAQFLLGHSYSVGSGVIRDRVLACMWYNLAAARSSGRNREVYAQVSKLRCAELTRAEVSEAQRLARQWDEAHSQNAEDRQVR